MMSQRSFFERHQRLLVWLALSLGMIVILLLAVRDKGINTSQLGWLVVACVGLAGACTWIISWE